MHDFTTYKVSVVEMDLVLAWRQTEIEPHILWFCIVNQLLTNVKVIQQKKKVTILPKTKIEFFDIYTGEKIQSFPIPIYKKNLKMSSRAKVEMKSVEIVAENKRQHLGDSLGSGGRATFSYRRKKSNI